MVGANWAIRRNPMILLKPLAAFKNIASQVLEHIANPNRLFSWGQSASEPKSHLKTESTEIFTHRLFVVVQRCVAISDKMEMAYPTVSTLVSADSVNRVGTSQHMFDHRSPMSRLLPWINFGKLRIDCIPTRGSIVLVLIQAFIFFDFQLIWSLNFISRKALASGYVESRRLTPSG